MRTIIITLLMSICLFGNAQEKSPTLFVDGTPIAIESDISLPYWLSAGRTVEFGIHVISLSILEFNVVDNELQFNQVIHLTSSGSVPSSKVWKIEALGVGFSNDSVNTTNGFSTSETPTIFTSPLTFTESATWIVPPSVTRVCIEVWGKGGDGGTGYNGGVYNYGGNGGGGAYGYQCFSVTPGTVLNIVLDDTASAVNDLISALNGEDGVRASDGGNHGTGGTSAAAYNIPGQDATSTQGGQGANGGQGGTGAGYSTSPTAAVFPGGGGGGGRSTSNVNSSAGTLGGGGQVKIYF